MTEKIVPIRTYATVFVALLVLLVASVVAAQFELGPWNTAIALGISVAKAVLILLFFMHFLYSSPLTRVVAVAALLWMGIGAVLTFGDYLTRDWTTVRWTEYDERVLDRPGAISYPPRNQEAREATK